MNRFAGSRDICESRIGIPSVGGILYLLEEFPCSIKEVFSAGDSVKNKDTLDRFRS